MAKVPAFNKAPAIEEIRATLSRASSRLSAVSAPLASQSVPAAGLPVAGLPPAGMPPEGMPPAGMPPLKAVPLADLRDVGVPAAQPFARDAMPVASAAPIVSRALASLDAVPAR